MSSFFTDFHFLDLSKIQYYLFSHACPAPVSDNICLHISCRSSYWFPFPVGLSQIQYCLFIHVLHTSVILFVSMFHVVLHTDLHFLGLSQIQYCLGILVLPTSVTLCLSMFHVVLNTDVSFLVLVQIQFFLVIHVLHTSVILYIFMFHVVLHTDLHFLGLSRSSAIVSYTYCTRQWYNESYISCRPFFTDFHFLGLSLIQYCRVIHVLHMSLSRTCKW